jgi:hypothetical protein
MDISKMSPEERARLRRNAEGKLADPKMAVRARETITMLDGQEAAETAALSAHLRGLPMARRVIEAFKHEAMTPTEARLLQVLLDRPNSTSTELSTALGWEGQAWHMHFGKMCQRGEARLWPAEPAVTPDANFYCGILADISENRWWTMKPEVVAGLAKLGLRTGERSR